jgi:multidrug efflux pump subunit AcrA (membrane-fusion protein)
MASIPYIVDVFAIRDDGWSERHVVASQAEAYALMARREAELRADPQAEPWGIALSPLALDSDLPALIPAADEADRAAEMEARLRSLADGDEDTGDALRDAIHRQAEAERLRAAIDAARDARDEAIRAALGSGRVSQREVAVALGLSPGMVARIASGRRASG